MERHPGIDCPEVVSVLSYFIRGTYESSRFADDNKPQMERGPMVVWHGHMNQIER
jgi:hypothetical protein